MSQMGLCLSMPKFRLHMTLYRSSESAPRRIVLDLSHREELSRQVLQT